MKWQGREGSSNINDQRGSGGTGLGGAGKLPMFGGGIGLLLLVLVFGFFGIDLSSILGGEQPSDQPVPPAQTQQNNQSVDPSKAQERQVQFVSVVLKETENVWSQVFKEKGYQYPKPRLTLYQERVNSGCGPASSNMGPFYCPADQTVYLDLSFFDELSRRFKAPGDFAMAYVIAHEVGHHVQTVTGITEKFMSRRNQMTEAQFNQYSVRHELQADYFAGVFAKYIQGQNLLEEGDIEEAMQAAQAVGDDTIQKNARGYAVPDSFTHGTSAQRMKWFMKGYQTGTLEGGDTFSVAQP